MTRDRVMEAVFMFLVFLVPMIVVLRVYATVFFGLKNLHSGRNKENTRRQ
jgi:hypothetical protein